MRFQKYSDSCGRGLNLYVCSVKFAWHAPRPVRLIPRSVSFSCCKLFLYHVHAGSLVCRWLVLPTLLPFRACLHEGGGPQVGEVTCGGLPHLTCKRDHIKMRDDMDRRMTPPTWDPHLHVNRSLGTSTILSFGLLLYVLCKMFPLTSQLAHVTECLLNGCKL